MARHKAQRQRRLTVMVKVGPVHRDQDVRAAAHLLRDPVGKAVPHVDARVAHQPVHLLDRMLGHQAARLRQGLADHRHRQRRACHHTKRGPRQCVDPFGMQVIAIQPADETTHVLQTPTRMIH